MPAPLQPLALSPLVSYEYFWIFEGSLGSHMTFSRNRGAATQIPHTSHSQEYCAHKLDMIPSTSSAIGRPAYLPFQTGLCIEHTRYAEQEWQATASGENTSWYCPALCCHSVLSVALRHDLCNPSGPAAARFEAPSDADGVMPNSYS